MRLYAEDVTLIFNSEKDMWELRLVETNEIVDTATTIVQLLNKHDCLK